MLKIGDIAAIHIDNKPSVYVRVEDIKADINPRWYQIRLLFLGFPPQEMTWILKDDYINGTPFTMKGIPIKIVPLPGPTEREYLRQDKRKDQSLDTPDSRRVVSINEIRKRKGFQDT